MKLGTTDIAIPAYALGTWAMGGGSTWGESDDRESIRTIHQALEMGVNFIDTAPIYGNGVSEELLKKALVGRRSECVLATKCGLIWHEGATGSYHGSRDGMTIRRNLSKESIIEQTEESLKRLGTDYIDLLLTHRQATEEFNTPIEETVEAFELLVEQGKIRAYGACNVNAEQLAEYQRWGNPSLIQERFSLLHREHSDLAASAAEAQITFQAYSPLERGVLSGVAALQGELEGTAKQSVRWIKAEYRTRMIALLTLLEEYAASYGVSVAALVLRWTASASSTMNVLFGARKIDHLLENVRAMDLELPSEVWQEIEEAAAPLLA
ncbi:MAG TPA: aldo/keto reductase [Sphaerochaeta sp.]|nr:aldo/keto reductase [Sphaerochaeta sp.]